jgi:hypothetical protein
MRKEGKIMVGMLPRLSRTEKSYKKNKAYEEFKMLPRLPDFFYVKSLQIRFMLSVFFLYIFSLTLIKIIFFLIKF